VSAASHVPAVERVRIALGYLDRLAVSDAPGFEASNAAVHLRLALEAITAGRTDTEALARSTIESQQRALDEAAAALSDALKQRDKLLASLQVVVGRWEGTRTDMTPREVRDARAVIAEVVGGDARLVGSAA